MQTIITGKVTNLTCQGKGNPQPTVVWLKNGHKIKKSNRITLFSSASGDKLVTSELMITETRYKDSGVYTCVIENTLGGTNSSETISVHGKFDELIRLLDLCKYAIRYTRAYFATQRVSPNVQDKLVKNKLGIYNTRFFQA